MVILNFAHPIPPLQQERIRSLLGGGEAVTVVTIAANFDLARPLAEQVEALLREGIAAAAPHGPVVAINPPGFAPAAAVLTARWAARFGAPPRIMVMRRAEGPAPSFEVGEIIDLAAG